MSGSPAVVVNVYEQGPDLSELYARVAHLLTDASNQLVTTVTQLLSQQGETIVADLTAIKNAVAALQDEDGLVVAGLQDLSAKFAAGELAQSDIDALAGTINGEVTKLSDAVSAAGEGPAPAPVPDPVPTADPTA